jgi:hypothetical protein
MTTETAVFQIRGADAFRRTVVTCLPYLLIAFWTETRDLSVT